MGLFGEDKMFRELFSQDDRVFHCPSCGQYIEGNDLLIHAADTSGNCPFCKASGVHEVEYHGEYDEEDDDDFLEDYYDETWLYDDDDDWD